MASVIDIAWGGPDLDDPNSGANYFKRGPLPEDELIRLADVYTSMLLDEVSTGPEDDVGDEAASIHDFLTYMRVRGYDDARDPDFCATALTAGGHAPWKAPFTCNPYLPILGTGESEAIPSCDGGGTLEPPDALT